jgi:hypothetical protein
MHSSHYQPKRSQQLFLAEQVRKKLAHTMDQIVVHHVLEDTPTRLYLQIERRAAYGSRIYFERVEL